MLIDEPAALVSGPLALLLHELAAAPAVRPYVRVLPVWARPYRSEIEAGLQAVAQAAQAWSSTAPERDNAEPSSAGEPESECSVAQAGALLGLGARRVQELAAAGELGGRRVGRIWLLNRVVVEQVAAARRRRGHERHA
ncbi:helix-turn-helix domain-containing protein [Pseudonocardia dioxanivorans]|jgi:excisionase family DNA binding protein|uniref:helix-turn-helix domain-containing protein n=1 Tax=Pseudonocardia dioxanivorans TaxID=240495 RepID=UPI000CD18430|nr:helix-turn-helix domain-containing protein [Pseudonocardia dioxanivorans]